MCCIFELQQNKGRGFARVKLVLVSSSLFFYLPFQEIPVLQFCFVCASVLYFVTVGLNNILFLKQI